MAKAMVEEVNGMFVVSCFSNGLLVEEMTFPSEKQAQYYARLYTASNWRLSNSSSSLSIH
jgi:hypothetical protein